MGYIYFFLPLIYLVVLADSFPFQTVTKRNVTQSVNTTDVDDPENNSRSSIKFPNNFEEHSRVPVRFQGTPWQGDMPASDHSRASIGSEAVVFPGQRPITTSKPFGLKHPQFIPKVLTKTPECAKGSTFCEEVQDYPSTYLEQVLEKTAPTFRSMFGEDIVTNLSLVHRIDAGGEEDTLCASREQLVYPKQAKTKDNKWLFVVNQEPYTQGIRIEQCLSTEDSQGQSCAFTEGFPLGYKTMCKQKYIYRKLLALDENGKTITDIFQIPSCCSCMVRSDGLRSRLGLPSQRQLMSPVSGAQSSQRPTTPPHQSKTR